MIAARFLFHIAGDAGSGASQVHSILQMVFSILPTNPVRPFLEGNNLQIVSMGVFVGVILLVAENEDGLLRRIMSRALDVVMKCVSVVCMFLPLYIFASLVMQIWESGAGMFLALWKPLTVCAGCTLAVMGCYLAIVCVKLKVKPGVLLLKLLPDYLIGLSIMLLQLHLPAEGLAVGVALVMLPDFLCTGAHIFVLHLELTLQADRLGLLNRETLRRKS